LNRTPLPESRRDEASDGAAVVWAGRLGTSTQVVAAAAAAAAAASSGFECGRQAGKQRVLPCAIEDGRWLPVPFRRQMLVGWSRPNSFSSLSSSGRGVCPVFGASCRPVRLSDAAVLKVSSCSVGLLVSIRLVTQRNAWATIFHVRRRGQGRAGIGQLLHRHYLLRLLGGGRGACASSPFVAHGHTHARTHIHTHAHCRRDPVALLLCCPRTRRLPSATRSWRK
jgi:hypothetical protein